MQLAESLKLVVVERLDRQGGGRCCFRRSGLRRSVVIRTYSSARNVTAAALTGLGATAISTDPDRDRL